MSTKKKEKQVVVGAIPLDKYDISTYEGFIVECQRDAETYQGGVLIYIPCISLLDLEKEED